MAGEPVPLAPPNSEGRDVVVERFVQCIIEHFAAEYRIVLLLPWAGSTPKPEGVLAPAGDDGGLSEEDLTTAKESTVPLVIPFVFDDDLETFAAARILPTLKTQPETQGTPIIFALQLMANGMRPSRATNDLLIQRHNQMLNFGVDNVLINPELTPLALRESLETMKQTTEDNIRVRRLLLELQGDQVTPEEHQALKTHHAKLFWEVVPKVLMPKFAPLDTKLVESDGVVGKYKLVRHMPTMPGTMHQATDDENAELSIKVIDKSKVVALGELESIYRELRFCSDIVKCNHVMRCFGVLHSKANVYLVFEYAGDQTMRDTLKAREGQRMDVEGTLSCFEQILRGVTKCHEANVSHRALCSDNICVRPGPDGAGYHCKVMNFSSAMSTSRESTSTTLCGCLPCIAPEIAQGKAYPPLLADSWSTGALLLELAGGLTAMSQAVPFEHDDDLKVAATAIQGFFSEPGSHMCALTFSGGPKHKGIASKLKALMQPKPSDRKFVRDVLEQMAPGAVEPAAKPVETSKGTGCRSTGSCAAQMPGEKGGSKGYPAAVAGAATEGGSKGYPAAAAGAATEASMDAPVPSDASAAPSS